MTSEVLHRIYHRSSVQIAIGVKKNNQSLTGWRPRAGFTMYPTGLDDKGVISRQDVGFHIGIGMIPVIKLQMLTRKFLGFENII